MNADSISSDLSKAAGQASRAARAEAEILKSAHERRDIVDRELDELRPRALSDRVAAEKYEDLIAERGHLDQVIGRSRAA